MKYRATPLEDGKSPAELFLNRSIRIKLDVVFPTKLQPQKSISSNRVRPFNVGDRVNARYYSNNKNRWKPGVIEKKLGS